MSLLVRELTIQSVIRDTLDVQPRGSGCDPFLGPDHVFTLEYRAGGFKYLICARCGTVRIGEDR